MSNLAALKTHLAEQIALADKATEGPWQVVETKHPHYLGGSHTERRIFTAWDHPQLKGPLGVVNGSVGLPAEKGQPGVHLVHISAEDAAFLASARTNFPKLCRQLKVALEVIEEGEHGVGCRYISPIWRSDLEDCAGTAECTCWKSRAIERILEAGV